MQVYLHKLPDAVSAMLPEEALQRPDALHRQPVPAAVLPGREEHARQRALTHSTLSHIGDTPL